MGSVASKRTSTAASKEMQADTDADVRFYSGQSLQMCDAKLGA